MEIAMMLSMRRNLLLGSSGLLLALLGSLATTARAQTLETIDYLFPAPAQQIAFAPWIIAQQRGYYAQEGLKLNFLSGRGGIDAAKQIGAGNAIIGHSFGDTPIIARSMGIPVKSVALLGGRSMMQVVVRADSAIKAPKDLKGKTITAMSYSDANFYALLGVLASAGLTKNDVNAQAVGPAGVWQLFAAGKSDAMTGVPEWIAEAKATGMKLRIMPAYDYFGSMAQAILASDETIQKRPELVRKVVKATLHGLRDVMSDPKSAARDYVAAMPIYAGREAFVEEVFSLYNQYVYPDQKVMGMMDPARLTALQNFYVKEGIVRTATPVADLYTNQFVQ
jgi:NitT/TauT family transport system substrate-binding protein